MASAQTALPASVWSPGPEMGVGRVDEAAGQEAPQPVRLHVYDLDSFTGRLLNHRGSWPRTRNMGLFHCGVEVHGWEYCFQYYFDGWEDGSVTGVQRHGPRRNQMFSYRESVELGTTMLSRAETGRLVRRLSEVWPANSYHLLARNCVSFAEALATELQVQPVPRWVVGLGGSIQRRRPLRGIVNLIWQLMVWAMIAITHEVDDPEVYEGPRAGPGGQLLQYTAAALALPCVLLAGLPLPGSAPRLLPLGFLLGGIAAAAAITRHWGLFPPLRWLERGALLASAGWGALRGLLIYNSVSPFICACGVAACLLAHRQTDPPKVGGQSRVALLVAARALAALAGAALPVLLDRQAAAVAAATHS